ncbi:MAG TPA: hypothetical protein PKI99_06630, partial [Terrimesophilobacter sp.]|nr:hypothetical protein [Terrimesophilobacter sp.]
MKSARTLALITCASVSILAGWPAPAGAISTFINFVSSVTTTDAYTNDPFNQSPQNTTVVPSHPYRNDPWTQFHPDPSHGFASSQGASALVGDGSGFAVHSEAILVPGDRSTRSQAIAAIEFEIVDPSTAFSAPVEVSFLGDYATGAGGFVSARLWQGAANVDGGGSFLFFANALESGAWSATQTLMTRQRYALRLEATASTLENAILASYAFIDPVISFDLGPDAVIQFDSSSTLQNPGYIPFALPEPAPRTLLGGMALAWA